MQSGEEYKIEALLVGKEAEPITWPLGSIKMPASVSSTLADVEDHFYPLPEIILPPAVKDSKRKLPAAIYIIISAIVLVPWIFLLNSWSLAGFSVIPSRELFSTRVSIFVPLFTLGIVALFALVVASWISLSIFTQLGALAVLVPPTAYFGFKAFQAQLNRK